jgi:predicted RNA binding protein with dsRBD fold (UPF0201 family)
MDEIIVHIEVEINPTEDPEKVKRAVENIFGKVDFEIKPQQCGSLLAAETKGLDGLTKLQNILRRERIRAAARGVLFDGLRENSITFYLNKQVAFIGHVSFSQPVAESPLGPIRIEIHCDNPRELIDWLAPRIT